MKKCPECGNLSYDGAPICGNCGYKFPARKVVAKKRDTDIFGGSPQKAKKPKKEKKASKPKTLRKQTGKPQSESTIEILKANKVLIGIIVAVTIIAICGIVLSGSHNETSNNGTATADTVQFSEYGFSFSLPSSWKEIDLEDNTHPDAIFLDAGNNTVVEFYNITSDYTSLKEINQERINKAESEGAYVDTVETLTIDERNASNIVLEEADGDYTRYVSIFTNGELYVFKITGSSLNGVNSDAINNMVSSAHIE